MNSSVAAQIADLQPGDVPFVFYGAAEVLLDSEAREILLSGPANTGKSRACLEKINYLCESYPGLRCLMVRKTRRSLTQSGMVTYEHKVLLPSQRVAFNTTLQQYRYPNGSVLAVGGLDKPSKIMSSEWDMIYAQEATELTEADWEACSLRLRNGKGPYHQLLADCNPDAPTHWIMQRSRSGSLLLVESRHEDNPTVTAEYLARLDQLTGVRYLRYRLGVWAAAEGMVYADSWQPRVHLIDRFAIPNEWPRYWVIDWGFTHPFVWQCWAKDGDGRLYREREIYRTGRTVPEHCAVIKRLTAGTPAEYPYAIIADPADAGSRALFEQQMGLSVRPADNAVSAGIQAVKERLRVQADDRARLYLLRDSVPLAEVDLALRESHLPTCTEEEFDSYVWQAPHSSSLGVGKRGEEPVKENDHGLDALRYLVSFFDLHDTGINYVEVPW